MTENAGSENTAKAKPSGNLVVFGLLACLAGLGTGLIGALFRLTLEDANRFRGVLIGRMEGWGAGGFVLLVALVAAAAAAAAWMVRRVAPSALGSGMPRVIAVMNGELPPAPTRVIPVKFVGGTLVIGSGLALGREGPTVQMGATISEQIGKFFRQNWVDCRALEAAGGGAGFAMAFNTPIAGAVFVLEVLVKRFETRVAIAALGASAAAIWVGRAVFGDTAEFSVGALAEPRLANLPFYVLMGIGAGLVGMFCNWTLLTVLKTADRLTRLPVELRAAIIGAVVGAVAWFAPWLVGSGDGLAQQALNGVGTPGALTIIVLARLGLIVCSMAAASPGGLLVPFLALGAEAGLWVGLLCKLALPDMAWEPAGFAIVGMAALFTGIVRAPVTGIVLVTEMTANVSMLLPMIAACFAAMLVPTLFGNRPILESLRERMVARTPDGHRHSR